MATEYRLISGDSHINEPPDLWQSRVPAQYRARAPRLEHLPEGDAWILEGAVDPINFGRNAFGGLPPRPNSSWCRFDEIRRGGYDPAARLAEQDADNVDAEVMYPTPRLSQALFWDREDPEFHLAMIRAYNDWLSEYCAHAPDRLVGIALAANAGVGGAVEELWRSARLPGLRGVTIGMYPSGELTLSPADDPFWAAAQDLDLSVAIHVSLTTMAPAHASKYKLTGEFRFLDAPLRVAEFIYGGVFDRFPGLKLVLAEIDCGWIPYAMEQMDDRYKRQHPSERKDHKLLPSEYFRRNLYYTYITDQYGVKNRHEIGVDRILWSSDYPHTGTDWPRSWDTINRHFEGVAPEEKQMILAGNAARLYHLN
jgi:predicted TIM-barrel fold metal-dependent hydrolase